MVGVVWFGVVWWVGLVYVSGHLVRLDQTG